MKVTYSNGLEMVAAYVDEFGIRCDGTFFMFSDVKERDYKISVSSVYTITDDKGENPEAGETADEGCIIHCDFCGKAFDLDNDDENFEISPCDACEKAICWDCLEKKLGKDYDRMTNLGRVYCPDCFPKYKHEIFKQDE